MGSGIKGGYHGTRGSSQPFASSYGVMPDMRAKDIKEGIYNEQRGYSRNPSAVELLSSMKNNTVYLDGKKANGLYTYVVNEKGELIFGKRNNPNDPSKRSPRPMLIGGKNPKVQCAGMTVGTINQTKKRILSSLPKQVFSRKSKWRKK